MASCPNCFDTQVGRVQFMNYLRSFMTLQFYTLWGKSLGTHQTHSNSNSKQYASYLQPKSEITVLKLSLLETT
jgi:hypothetical protein